MIYRIYAKTNEVPKSPLARLYAVLFFTFLTITIFSITNTPYKINKSNLLYVDNLVYPLEYTLIIEGDDNSTKMGYIYINDLKKIFGDNIKYDENKKELIVVGENKVIAVDIDNNISEVNGMAKSYNFELKEINNKVYIPLEIIKDAYWVDIYYNTNKVAIFKEGSNSKRVRLKEDTYLKANEYIVSGTINKIYQNREYIFVEETKENIKLMTNNVEFGYVNKKYVSEIIETNSSESNKNNVNKEEIEVITNYETPKTNYKELASQKSKYKIGSKLYNNIRLFRYNKTSELEELHSNDNYDYKDMAKTLNEFGIYKLGNIEIRTTNKIFEDKLDTYSGRKEVIENILEKIDKFELDGININFQQFSDKARLTTLLIELNARLNSKDKILVVTDNNLGIPNLEKIVTKVIRK